MRRRLISAAASVLLVAGCGGGGDDPGSTFPTSASPPQPVPTPAPPPPPSIASAQGFYVGTTTTSSRTYAFNAVILESGEIWGIYGIGGVLYGAVHGSAVAMSASTFQAYGYDTYLPTGSVASASASGTFVPKASISGTAHGVATSTFSGVYDPSYDVPAKPADVEGTWRGQALSPGGVDDVTVTIGPTGAFGGSVSGCSYSGTVAPRPGGKAVFNLRVSFGGPPCLFANKTLNGISVRSGDALLSAALLQDGSAGFLSAGTKQ